MLETVGTFDFVIDAYLGDFRGKATLPMIGGFMLQSATKHAEERGFGYSYMTSQNRAWVLSRMAIEINEYPKNENIFKIRTWVASVNRFFTERYFAFETESGKNIGYAKSLWASIDIETRRPTNVLDLKEMTDFINGEEPCPIDDLKKVASLKDDCEPAGEFVIKYSDIDVNKHLNSMKYIEHLVDTFDIHQFVDQEIRKFEINYLSEAVYGEEISIVRKEENSTFVLEMKSANRNICSSKITWAQ